MLLELSLLFVSCHFLFATSLPTDCGKTNSSSPDLVDWRILGGQKSKSSEWPWQVAVRRETELLGEPFVLMTCGGSIISKDWVLTAAHCVYSDPDPKSYMVYLGYSDLNETSGKGMKAAVTKVSRINN